MFDFDLFSIYLQRAIVLLQKGEAAIEEAKRDPSLSDARKRELINELIRIFEWRELKIWSEYIKRADEKTEGSGAENQPQIWH